MHHYLTHREKTEDPCEIASTDHDVLYSWVQCILDSDDDQSDILMDIIKEWKN